MSRRSREKGRNEISGRRDIAGYYHGDNADVGDDEYSQLSDGSYQRPDGHYAWPPVPPPGDFDCHDRHGKGDGRTGLRSGSDPRRTHSSRMYDEQAWSGRSVDRRYSAVRDDRFLRAVLNAM